MIPADLALLPKAELHVHLEGALRPATMEEFISRSALPIPRSFTDLDSFVDMFGRVWATMNQPGDYARMVREYCEDAARAGIRYAEIELAPAGRPNGWQEAVDAATQQSDVVVRFTVGVPRTFPIEVGYALLEATRGIPDVIGIGLGGSENGYPPEAFAPLFDEARSRGLHCLPHAGEDAGPESVRGALDALRAERIQHGVRAVEDASLVAELAARRIPLAMCLHSNLRLGVVRSLDEHPIRELWQAGVLLSVNTDDPGYFGHDMIDEYREAGRLLDLDRSGYGQLALNSVEGSFAPKALKKQLKSEIAAWVSKE